MLSRLLPKPSHFSILTRISSKFHPCPHPHLPSPPLNPTTLPTFLPRFFSSGGGDDQPPADVWKLSKDTHENMDPLFGESSGDVAAKTAEAGSWKGGDEWDTAEGFKPWSLGGEDEKNDDLFKVGDGFEGDRGVKIEEVEDEEKRKEEEKRLEVREKELTAVIKGPNRAFGDLIAASGITDDMLDSLIALKDFEGIKGLPPLHEIEDIRYQKSTSKSARADIERQKQEEVAKARVRQVDDKGRAYGTGRRKCSIARVWIQPGHGNFVINDTQFDAYFPMLDHRAAILRPFSETKTLGLWDIDCTVQGGGLSGQVGAIRLGVSRALQNWEPDLRPTLKASGFLTRDPRVVERKKPGKAGARKSFQWVKR